ncbi:hypothetical protein MASR2M69_06830 [Bacteroidota bacterium]
MISVDKYNDNKFSITIPAWSEDSLCEPVWFYICEDQYNLYINTIQKAKAKYIEWVNIAKNNNIENHTKVIPLEAIVDVCFNYKGQSYFQFNVNQKIIFYVSRSFGKIEYLLLLVIENIKSYDNENITSGNINLVFTSSKEIQDFIDAISLENINAFRANPKTEELFK